MNYVMSFKVEEKDKHLFTLVSLQCELPCVSSEMSDKERFSDSLHMCMASVYYEFLDAPVDKKY